MEVLFQDESIIIVNKPAGLLTIRDGYNPDLPTVKTILEADFGRCWIVHRLDKDTSGVLLLARNETTHRLLNLAFQNRQIKKVYQAIVIGSPKDSLFVIEEPLKVDGDRKHRTVVDHQSGKPAKSIVTVLKSFQEFSLLSIVIETGYTHQIRAHLSSLGYPILGDKLYQTRQQFDQFSSIIDRTALHAFEITFLHPITNERIMLTAQYPKDFQTALDILN